MSYHLITAAFLVAALLSAIAGVGLGMLIFAAAGLVLESVFWFRTLRRRRGSTHA